MAKTAKTFQRLPVAVLTISNRHNSSTDSSGDLLCQMLSEAGHQLVHRAIVPSNLYQIRAAVSALICEPDCQVILINGGTGFSPDNHTVPALRALFDHEVPGFGEIFRQLSFATIGSAALQSNAVAGIANHKLLVAMPGSPNACELAMQALVLPQLDARQGPCNFVPLLSARAESLPMNKTEQSCCEGTC
jgi:molybdenum cofactor biosynthesis protein B